MRTGVIAGVQARTSSSRLPRKVLADVAGKPLILRVVERARASLRVDDVVVLTSTDPSDDELVLLLEREGVPVRRGPLDDVLARYEALLKEHHPRYVVRITGDSPLMTPLWIPMLPVVAGAATFGLVMLAGFVAQLHALLSARASPGDR